MADHPNDPAWAALFDITYEELRRLARHLVRRDPRATINPTGLVSEAWLRLKRSPSFEATSPLHFKRIATRAMRRVLTDSARRRQAERRGGEDALRVTLGDDLAHPATEELVLALDEAIDRLATLESRQAEIIELHYFGGMEFKEIVELLAISESTAMRDWRAARAWLRVELGRDL
jgi:RNA polymerase sigma-70 factor, ECF subfamily